MRNSGKKRGSTGDPLFCLKTSRGRPSRRAVCAACRGGWDRPPGRRRSRSAGCSRVRRSAGRANSSRTASGFEQQIHSVSRFSDAAASIMWSVTIDASMSEMFLPSYLRVHASEVSAQTMTAVGAPKSRVQRARRSMPSFDCTTTSRWAGGWRRGGHAARFEDQLQFSGSTCLERYLRQAYRFFASFRKSICKGFNYIKVRDRPGDSKSPDR